MAENEKKPVAVPVPAATVLMIRDGASGIEVFMVKRHHQIDFVAGGVLDDQRSTNETLGTFFGRRLAREEAADCELFRCALEFRLAGNLDTDTRPIRSGSETQRVVAFIGAKEKRFDLVGNVLQTEDLGCEGRGDLRLGNRKSHIAKLDGWNARR